MPLHSQSEPIAARIFDSLDNTVRRPGRRHQFPSHCFDRLMMMTVDGRAFTSRQLPQDAVFQHAHPMRMSIARRALFVLDSIWMLANDVLYQRSAAGNIQRLNAEADCKQWHPTVFDSLERQQVSLVLHRMHTAKSWMRLAAVSLRIHVGIAPRPQKSIQAVHYTICKIRFRNQRNLNRKTT